MKANFFLASLGIAVFAWIIAVGVIGCGESVKTSTDFIPHVDGYRWEYKCYFLVGTSETSVFKRIRYLDGTTTLPNGLSVQNFIVTDEVNAQTTKAFGIPISTPGYYCYIDDTGVYRYGMLNHPTTEATLILPLPLEVGKIWQRGSILTYEAIATEEVSVPAGTFNTVKVNLKGSGTTESEWYEWYAGGVGMVKISMDVFVTTIEGDRIIPEPGYYIEELLGKNF